MRCFLAAGAEGDAGDEIAWGAEESIAAEAGDDAEGAEGGRTAEGLPTAAARAANERVASLAALRTTDAVVSIVSEP